MSNAIQWKNSGYKLPAELEDALAVANALEDLSFEQAPAPPSLAGVKPNAVGKLVSDHGKALADHRVAQEAREALEVSVKALVAQETRAAVPSILEQMRPAFDEAASRFVEAVRLLPENFTSEGVGRFSREQFEAYADARETVVVLAAADTFVSANSGGIPHFACRINAPETPAQFDLLVQANSGNRIDNPGIFSAPVTDAERSLGYRHLIAARNGIPFELPETLAEPAKRLQEIENKRQEAAAKQAANPAPFVRPGVGWK